MKLLKEENKKCLTGVVYHKVHPTRERIERKPPIADPTPVIKFHLWSQQHLQP